MVTAHAANVTHAEFGVGQETMQWGMDGIDAKGEASYIGLDATHVAVELKELNDHFQFTRTHYQNTSYQMLRTGKKLSIKERARHCGR